MKEEPAQTSAPSTVSSSDDTTTTSSSAEDSYEARREARRKAREERLKNSEFITITYSLLTYIIKWYHK